MDQVVFNEFDYSIKAKRLHKKYLKRIDLLEKVGISISLKEARDDIQRGAKQVLMTLLLETFSEADRYTRKFLWLEIVHTVNQYHIDLSFSTLKKLRKVFLIKKVVKLNK